MIKYIVFNLPSVLNVDEATFFSETDIPAKEFRTWKDDFDAVDEDIEERISEFLSETFGFEAIMYAFAKPFEACGFTDVADDSQPTEALTIDHASFSDVALMITEDGFELFDYREDSQLPGIYDFSEWQQLRDILQACQTSANGDLDKYIQNWKDSLPKD